MWGALIAGCVLAAAACAQSDSSALLNRLTAKVLGTVDRLPRYMCTETIDRYQYQSVGKGGSCDPATQHKTHLTTADRLRLDVAVAEGREMYSWVGESHFEDRSLFELVNNGALSTGSFFAFLTVVFRHDNQGFADRGPVTENGRQLEAFDFRVPKAVSHYQYAGAGVRVMTGYYGTILVDPQTADLVRLEVHTDDLPAETETCRSSSILDYTRLRLNDADFLLPSRSELQIYEKDGGELRNITVFSGCHEFLGESTLHFDEAPDAAVAVGAIAESGGAVPAGIAFQLSFPASLDPDKSAAGDKITATLTSPLRGPNRQVLAPKGATVPLRILEMQHFYGAVPALRIVLQPESVEVQGRSRRLVAGPDTRPVPMVHPPSAPRRNQFSVQVMEDNQHPHAGVLLFLNVSEHFKVPAGFESRWLTGAHKQ